jgi:Fe2+ or Zn2+ uptake regulation protein
MATDMEADMAMAALLTRGRIKPTAQRCAVLAALLEASTRHELVQADEIYAAVQCSGRSISLAQVHNILKRLAEAGLVERYRPGDAPSLFAAKRAQRFSALLLCLKCRHRAGFLGPALSAEFAGALAASGLRVQEQIAVARGLCRRCRPEG